MRHTGSDEDDEYQELDERLDYNIPESCRVIVRCVASLVLATRLPLPLTVGTVHVCAALLFALALALLGVFDLLIRLGFLRAAALFCPLKTCPS